MGADCGQLGRHCVLNGTLEVSVAVRGSLRQLGSQGGEVTVQVVVIDEGGGHPVVQKELLFGLAIRVLQEAEGLDQEAGIGHHIGQLQRHGLQEPVNPQVGVPRPDEEGRIQPLRWQEGGVPVGPGESPEELQEEGSGRWQVGIVVLVLVDHQQNICEFGQGALELRK